MTDYISREAFVEAQRHLYCENCARRKGMKRGKMQFVYEIGDAPCRACGYGDVIDDAEDFPAADVVEVKRGEWRICEEHTSISKTRGRETHVTTWMCSNCFATNGRRKSNFCPNCGANMEEQT